MITGIRRTRFSPNVADTVNQLVAGVNALTTVTTYVNALISSDLPTFENPPSWWTTFTTNFTSAKTSAMEWVNGIQSQFNAIPSYIVDYNSLFSTNVQMIQQYCSLLESGNGTSSDQQSLTNTLNTLVNTIGDYQADAQGLSTQLSSFAQTLGTANTNMAAALQDALQTEGADQDQVNALQAQINSLNAQIAQDNQAITAGYILLGVSIFLTLAGVALSILLGGGPVVFVVVLGLIGVGAAITSIVTNQQDIQTAAASIQSDQNQLSTINQQIVTLNCLQTMLSNLITLCNNAQQAMQAIDTAWGDLSGDISTVVGDLSTVSGDNTDQNWSQLSTDIGTAQADWNTLESYASNIANVTVNISNAVTNIPTSN